MEIKFGKYAGHLDTEVAKDPKGRSWMQWVMKQPSDPKYADKNKERNERWEALIAEAEGGKELPKPIQQSSDLKVIQAQLDIIAGKLDELLARN